MTYVLEHPEVSITGIAKKFGVAESAIHTWRKKYKESNGFIPSRGRGNYSSDEAKEIARLKKELKDTQDVLKNLLR